MMAKSHLDDRGVVLWYLSETINTEEPKEKLNLVDNNPNRHTILLMSNLMDYGTSIQEGEETFEGAYRRSQVADTIFEAIKSKDKLIVYEGFVAALSILVPFDTSYRRDSVNRIVSRVKIKNRKIQNMARIIANLSYVFFSAKVISFSITAISFIIILIVNDPNLLKLMPLGEMLQPSKIKGVLEWFFLVSMFISVILYFVKEGSFLGTAQGVLKRTYGKSREMKEDVLLKNYSKHLYETVGTLCGRDHRLLLSMLLANSSIPWEEIALTSTKSAIPEVIGKALQWIRHPEISEIMRERIFQWLCKINILCIQPTAIPHNLAKDGVADNSR